MPAHDHGETRRRGLQVERLQVMQDVNQGRARLGDCGLRKLRTCAGVDISPYRHQRREFPQLLQDFRVAHIARVNDQVRTRQRPQRFRAKQPMGIGNEPDCANCWCVVL